MQGINVLHTSCVILFCFGQAKGYYFSILKWKIKIMSDIFSLFQKISSSSPAPTGQVEFIVLGIGNIGAKYDGTRHNVGFDSVNYAAKSLNFKVDKIKYKSQCGEAMIDGHRVLFMKPGTYVNLSGQAAVEAMNFHKVPPEKLIVVCDDVALDTDRLRIRLKGSHGGHNGLKNIIQLLGSDNFPRIKIGVGKKPHPDYDLADWVLSTPRGVDKENIEKSVEDSFKAVSLIVKGETQKAMNLYNR